MLATLVIVFREVLEAGLIIGIVLAATTGVRHRGRFVAGGVAAGVAGAALLATFAGALSNAFSGVGQEVFNAAILSLAVVMLGIHTVWMARHGRQMAADMKAMGRSIVAGDRSLAAMALVVGVAVLREGSEVVLFLFGIVTSTHEGAAPMLLGGALGIVGGGAVSWLLYRGLVAIPTGHLFAVTNWMIALLAAGMAGQAAAILANADLIPTLGDQLWDSSGILRDDSLPGRALHALVGYSDRPSGVQLLAVLVTLATLIILSKVVAGRRVSRVLPARAPRDAPTGSALRDAPTGSALREAPTARAPTAGGLLAAAVIVTAAGQAGAREWYVGGPVKAHDMEIVANYLKGVEMAPMPADMPAMGQGDVIHLEADIHATADNVYGYADGAWIPYLTVEYDLKKLGAGWSASGTLLPMTAKDGPHYANNLTMGGEGEYRLTYTIHPPAPDTFWRHVDRETGVPDWWPPITESFTFKYPQK